ncbi:MAG TPA: sulfotransferase domain-containing protein [Tepidisphaeraceae bacterium]|nr:sulfotransferase domain-containing protein [Tepidisphaeraceae bacterium]
MIDSTMTLTEQTKRKTARQYDHSAFYPTVRPTDVFLCSYPKSGTTWLGFLIAQVLKKDESEELDLKSFNKYVPDVNLQYTKRGSLAQHAALPDPRFLLCHATYDAKLPKVVYVTRDPRDVMVSYWHYQKFLKEDFNLSLADFLRSDDHWPCEWDEHVADWLLPEPHGNVLRVGYEEIHQDAAGVLRRVLQFGGVKASEARITAAVECSRFENMRAAEERFGVNGKAGDEQERFVRKGRVGSWQDEMGYTELRIVEERYGRVMRQVGYEPLS